MDWHLIEDAAELQTAHAALSKLCALFEAERADLAALDFAAIERRAGEKQAQVIALRQLAGRAPRVQVYSDNSEQRALRSAVRELAARLQATARAQATLYADLVDALGEVLGVKRPRGTYDARGRSQVELRPLAAKAL